uniref:Uncharacterized protein n=1 Tax=Arundo donax TaxID=35708 RepID=A0A0A8ZRT2_ARUDO
MLFIIDLSCACPQIMTRVGILCHPKQNHVL